MESLTYRRLLDFFNPANAYLQDNTEHSEVGFGLIKLTSFYRKKIDNIQRNWQEEVNEALEEIRVKYCEKDKDGIFKEKTYGEGEKLVIKKVFTPDNEAKANKEIRLKSREIEEKWMNFIITETKTHIVKVPASIDITWIEAFTDFIFDPMSEDELEKHYLAQGEKKEPELIVN